MKYFLGLALACLSLLVPSAAAEFAVYDVFLEPHGEPIAAYQLKIWDQNSAVKILSVEGGEHKSYRKPPFFDPKAIQKNVIKLAAFATDPPDALPNRKTRVATLHVEINEALNPRLIVVIEAAARPGGSRIFTEATISKRETP